MQKLTAWILRYDRWLLWLVIPLVSMLMHWKIWPLELRGPHVWRQTQTQQVIDSFAEEDFNILHPRHLERGNTDGILKLEFPIYQWLVAVPARILGETVFLSRLMSFLFSLIAAWAFYDLLRQLFPSPLTALMGAYLFLLSPAIYYYGFVPMPDVPAMALSLGSLSLLMRYLRWEKQYAFIASACLMGLAIMTKLPYAMFAAAHGAVWLARLLQSKGRNWKVLIFQALALLLAFIPAMLWYWDAAQDWGSSGALDGLAWGNWEKAEIWRTIWFQVTVLVPRILLSLPAFPLVILGAVLLLRRIEPLQIPRAAIALWAVLLAIGAFWIFEFKVIGVDQDYYLIPLVPFLAMLAAHAAGYCLQSKHSWPGFLAICLLMLVPLMTFRRIHPRWEPQNAEFNRDLVTYQEDLRKITPDTSLVVAGPDISHNIFLYYIDKKGWSWDQNQGLSAQKLQNWHQLGAKYLYCDDRDYDQQPEIAPFLGKILGKFGKIYVYELKSMSSPDQSTE